MQVADAQPLPKPVPEVPLEAEPDQINSYRTADPENRRMPVSRGQPVHQARFWERLCQDEEAEEVVVEASSGEDSKTRKVNEELRKAR